MSSSKPIEIPVEEDIKKLASELGLVLYSEEDRAYIAGWLHGVASCLGKSGMSIRNAKMCLTLDVPKEHKAWTKEHLD